MTKSTAKKHSGTTTLFVRITKSVVLLIVSLFLLTGVVLGGVVYATSTKSTLEQLDEISTAYTLAVEKELGILQEQINSIAQYAANMEGSLDSQSINQSLDEMKASRGFVTIYGIDKSGTTSIPGVSVNDREYFQASMKGQFYSSSPFLKSDNTVGITVAGPVYRNNSIAGIVTVGINYDYFSKFVDFRIGSTGSSVIIDKTGTIVADLDTGKVKTFFNPTTLAKQDAEYKSQAEAFSSFLSGDMSSRNYTSADGVKKVAIAKKIPNTDNWMLVTTMDSKEINKTSTMVLILLTLIVLAGLAVGVICAMMLAKSISNPIKSISTRLTALSNGDLSSDVELCQSGDEIQTLSEALQDTSLQLRSYIKEIDEVTVSMAKHNLATAIAGDFKGEFRPIKESLNKIIRVMNRSFSEIAVSSEQVNAGAEQVSSAAQTLSQGAVEQAGSIEKLASTIGIVSGQVKDNASDAASAKVKANEIGHQIEESSQKMLDLSSAMDNISRASDEIGKIIKTIDDIAFQTNILALNAAVEAARAGEAGKGFAVVADEVRNLASKSAEASKNTTDLISSSIDAINRGGQIAQDMERQFDNVVLGVKDVVTTIERISGASSAQASSIEEITIGIEQISGVVQANSATAEESAAASEELSGQSSILKELTDQFVLTQTE